MHCVPFSRCVRAWLTWVICQFCGECRTSLAAGKAAYILSLPWRHFNTVYIYTCSAYNSVSHQNNFTMIQLVWSMWGGWGRKWVWGKENDWLMAITLVGNVSVTYLHRNGFYELYSKFSNQLLTHKVYPSQWTQSSVLKHTKMHGKVQGKALFGHF